MRRPRCLIFFPSTDHQLPDLFFLRSSLCNVVMGPVEIEFSVLGSKLDNSSLLPSPRNQEFVFFLHGFVTVFNGFVT